MPIVTETHRIQEEIRYLTEEQKTGFFNVSSYKCVALVRLKTQLKSDQAAQDLFPEFKELYRDLMERKLILRNAKKFNQELKKKGVLKEERKEQTIAKFETVADQMDGKKEKAMAIAEKIKWMHGTNSASLPVLTRSGMTLRPTGKLLDEGYGPMCGEITGGGMASNGVNQDSISVGVLRQISMCWNYASKISHTFSPEKFTDDTKKFFQNALVELKSYMTGDYSDASLIRLLQFKQWNPEEFDHYCQEFKAEIEALFKEAKMAHFSVNEKQIIKMLAYDTEILREAKIDPAIRKQVLKDFPMLYEKDLVDSQKHFHDLNFLSGSQSIAYEFWLYPVLILKTIIALKIKGLTPRQSLCDSLPEINLSSLDSIVYAIIDAHQPPYGPNSSYRQILDIFLNLEDSDRAPQILKKIHERIEEVKMERAEHSDDQDWQQYTSEVLQVLQALICPSEELYEALKDSEKEAALLKDFPALEETGLRQWLEKPIHLSKLLKPLNLEKRTTADVIIQILQIKLYHKKELRIEYYPGTQEHFNELLGAPYTLEHYLEKVFLKPFEKMSEKKKVFHERKLLRLEQLFTRKTSNKFSEKEMKQVLRPFPILLGSMNAACVDKLRTDQEKQLNAAGYGKEIDFVFVPKENKREMREWLEANGIGQSVKVYSAEKLDTIQKLPLELIHGKDAVILDEMLFSKATLEYVNALANKAVVPLYRMKYPSGAPRMTHGVTHASRVMLWSIFLAELYHDKKKKISVNPSSLVVAAGLHDAARKDDGVDIWDEESGQMARDALVKLGDRHAAFLGQCVAKKDDSKELPIEKKIIHDADCIDILRCIDADSFKLSELFISQDLNPSLAVEFYREALSFIRLTESKEIKAKIDGSEEPLKLLFQIMEYAGETRNKFSLMRRYLSSTFKNSGLAVDLDESIKRLIDTAIQ